jgi:vacuolar-type H+-ATPase subunit I/STV1
VRNEDINLETDLVDEMTFTTSSNDDDIKVTIQYDAQPDHEELSTYLMNGKDETERTKNIKLSVSTFIKRQVEILVSSIDSCDVINGTKSKEIMKTVTRLIKEGEVISEDPKETKESLEKVLGITIRNIQFGDIDYSDEISEARNNKKVIQKQAEAIKELSDKTGMEMEEAAKFVQSENGSATRIIFDAPPTLSSVTVLPGAIQPENKKSKKKGNS